MNSLQIQNLGSGSRGNCTIIRHHNQILMIDCGFSRRQTVQRLAAIDLTPATICGILVTHEHTDHITGAARLSQDTGAPIMATGGTLTGGGLTHLNTRTLRYTTPIDHAGFTITPVRVSHDTAEPCAFLVEVAGRRTLFVTDIGTTEGFDISSLTDLDYLYVEANHDEAMLRDGPYPAFLKQRIAGVGGHLNNRQCGGLIKSLAAQSPGLKAVMLAHLSDKNNEPELALATVRNAAGPIPQVRWCVARQHGAVGLCR